MRQDQIIIRKIENTYMICGTPWPDETGIARNISMPLT